MLYVFISTSQKIKVAPQYKTTLAVETHVKAGTITSSPGPIPIATKAECNAVVQEVVASAWLTLCMLLNSASNFAT